MQELSLSEKYKKLLGEFLKNLIETYQKELVSVSVYGSAARGEFAEKHSNINILVVLEKTDLASLVKMSDFINSRKYSIFSPLFFTQDYIRRSTDVFPIEFLDMKENYSLVYGQDCLKKLEIDLKNLRFQCEQELKSKLINIKRSFIKNRKDNQVLRNLLFKNCTSVLHILKSFLRLKNKQIANLGQGILKGLESEFKVDTNNFGRILEAKNKNLKLGAKDLEILLSNFVNDLEKIIDNIDAL